MTKVVPSRPITTFKKMLKTKVIASSITNLTDARYFAAWEVNWLGFCFDEASENHITPQAMYAMKEWVDGVQFMGEFRGATADEIVEHVMKLGLDAVQVDEFTGIDVLMELQDIVVFKEINITADADSDFIANLLEQFAPYCAHFIFKLENGLPDSFAAFAEHHSIWLEGNLSPEKIAASKFKGICLKGGMEEKVGFKSFDELDEVFEILEA